VKRREPLNLAHVLEDRSPATIPVPIIDPTGGSGPRPAAGAVGVPTPRLAALEKRIHTRFDKAFLVMIGSEIYGDTFAVARNISAGGILVEMSYAPPLGTVVTVHFQHVREDAPPEESEIGAHRGAHGSRDATRGGVNGAALPGHPGRESPPLIDELMVRAEVKHHHYLNFTGGNDAASARAIGLRFLEFVDPDERIPPDRWH
jgi:hypothetical protein